jgi:hypothetical protein
MALRKQWRITTSDERGGDESKKIRASALIHATSLLPVIISYNFLLASHTKREA